MTVITISGQVGAGETIVAHRVSEALGYRYVDRSIFQEVLKEYGFVDFKGLLDSPLHFLDRLAGDKRNTADLLNKMYLLFAKKNNIVINSRRAFLVLDSFINVLNVFLKAPPTVRIQNLVRWEKIDERSAGERIKEEEALRKKIIESFYKKRWDSLEPWTLVLSTHKLGLDLVVKMILDADSQVAKFNDAYGWQDGFPTIDIIETDPILENAVNKVISGFEPEAMQKEQV